MKILKVAIIAVMLAFIAQNISGAIQNSNISEQKEINKKSAEQLNASVLDYVQKFDRLTERYYTNLRTCEPLHYHQYMDIFGLKINLNADINGWNNGKCEYRMAFNIDSIGKDIREVFDVKVTDEQLAKISPRVECNFTQEQLNLVVDTIIAMNEKNREQFREMLQNPNEKYVKNTKHSQKLTKEEEQLIALLAGDNVCTIPNKDELTSQILEIMYKQ